MTPVETIYHVNIPSALTAPIILSAPHAGREFPTDFLRASPLSVVQLLETADLGTDALIADFALPVIHARYARSFVDLNRDRSWLDHQVVADVPRRGETQIQSGYGVIPRFAARGFLTHPRKITRKAAEARLQRYYDPYHQQLRQMIDQVLRVHGQVLLIDVHSAPASALGTVEVQFGTRFGNSIGAQTLHDVATSFDKFGLHTAFDYPFAGGFITQHYANASVETLQIEINRGIINSPSFRAKWRAAMTEMIKGFGTDNIKCAAE